MTDVLRRSEKESAATDEIEAAPSPLIGKNFYEGSSCKSSLRNDTEDFPSAKEPGQEHRSRTDQSGRKGDRKEDGDSQRRSSISADERECRPEGKVQDHLVKRPSSSSVGDVRAKATDTIMQTAKVFTEKCQPDQAKSDNNPHSMNLPTRHRETLSSNTAHDESEAVTSDGSDRNKEARQPCVPEAKQDVINELSPIASQGATNSGSVGSLATDAKGSSELTRRMSRTEGVRQDARRLKSATLGRMGQMFKGRPPTPVRDKSAQEAAGTENASGVEDGYGKRQPSRKEKTNSLGRMFKLVDKDGAPKKLFVHPRAGSLSRILRRHSNNEDGETIGKTAEDSSRGIFSRMFSQFRGK